MEENAGGEGMTPGDGCVVGVAGGGGREKILLLFQQDVAIQRSGINLSPRVGAAISAAPLRARCSGTNQRTSERRPRAEMSVKTSERGGLLVENRC